MKKTLKTLMLIAIIAMGINLTEAKAETSGEITVPETTVQEEQQRYRKRLHLRKQQ